MNNAIRLSGLGVNLITPFNAAGEIDFPALERVGAKDQIVALLNS